LQFLAGKEKTKPPQQSGIIVACHRQHRQGNAPFVAGSSSTQSPAINLASAV